MIKTIQYDDDYQYAIVKNYPRQISARMRIEVLKRDRGICQICGKNIDLNEGLQKRINPQYNYYPKGKCPYHIDHITPLYKGGKTTFSNLRLACNTCNMKRKRKEN